MLHGAPETEGPPPPGFDPSRVGPIVRVSPSGARSYAAVTMPTGLVWDAGRLYAAAWSVADQLGIPRAGQVVRVRTTAFRR